MTVINIWQNYNNLTNEERLIRALIQTLWQTGIIKFRPDEFIIDDTKLTVIVANSEFTVQLNDLCAGIGTQLFIDYINNLAE